MSDRIALQNAEFDALTERSKKWATLQMVAVVDDDYPEYRHYYESALRTFLDAVAANRELAATRAATGDDAELCKRLREVAIVQCREEYTRSCQQAAARIESLAARVATLTVERDGAVKRGQMVLDAKEYWRETAAHRGRSIESLSARVAEAERERDAARPLVMAAKKIVDHWNADEPTVPHPFTKLVDAALAARKPNAAQDADGDTA